MMKLSQPFMKLRSPSVLKEMNHHIEEILSAAFLYFPPPALVINGDPDSPDDVQNSLVFSLAHKVPISQKMD